MKNIFIKRIVDWSLVDYIKFTVGSIAAGYLGCKVYETIKYRQKVDDVFDWDSPDVYKETINEEEASE